MGPNFELLGRIQAVVGEVARLAEYSYLQAFLRWLRRSGLNGWAPALPESWSVRRPKTVDLQGFR